MNLPRRTCPPSQYFRAQECLANVRVHISTVPLTLTWHSCDCPGKSLARSSFSAGPMSYRESMIWVMFGLVESVIELLVPEVSIHDRKAFVNQIGWFEKHM